MQLKFDCAHKFLLAQIVDCFVIINIVDLNAEIVGHFEIVLNLDLAYKCRIQIVVDDLGLA